MPRIYISHRPEDSSRNEVAIIRERLIAEFGEDNILQSTGSNMEVTTNLQRLVQSCDVLLVVIGRYWVNMVDEQGNYLLEDPYDPIHVEIDAGLKTTMVVAVLVVDRAPIPAKDELPEVLRPLLDESILEAPDHDHLERILDDFVDLWSKIPKETNRVRRAPIRKKVRQRESSNKNKLAMGVLIVFLVFSLVSLFIPFFRTESRSDNIPPKFLSDEPITASNADRLTVLERLQDGTRFYQMSDTGSEFVYLGRNGWCTYDTVKREDESCYPKYDRIYSSDLWDEQTDVLITLSWRDGISIDSERWDTKILDLEYPVAVASFSSNDVGHAVVSGRSGELLWIDYQENDYTTTTSFLGNDISLSKIQLQVDPNQQTLLVQFNNQLQLWDVQTREQIYSTQFDNNIGYIEFVSLFNELKIFVVTEYGMIYYLSPDTLEIIHQTSFFTDSAYPKHKIQVNDVSSTGLMAVVRDKFTLELWDLYSEELVYENAFYISTENAQFTSTGNAIVFFISSRGLILGIRSE